MMMYAVNLFLFNVFHLQENIQILRDLSLLQIQMRDLEGYRVIQVLAATSVTTGCAV